MSQPTSPWRGFAFISVAIFIASLDLFIVNIAFPAIGEDFPEASVSGLSWILSAYAIVFAALLVPFGKLGDLVGRLRVFRAGLAVFTLGSALCALAPSAELLVAARVVQAAGAAALTPTSLGLVLPRFPAERRSAVIGAWAALGGVGAAMGPPLGGLLVELSWHWIFVINVPLGLLCLAFVGRYFTEIRDPSGRLPDGIGAVLAVACVGLLALGLAQGPDWGWDGRVLGCLAGAVVTGAMLVARSRRHLEPVLALDLLRSPTFSLASLATFVFFAGFAGLLLVVSLFLQLGLHFTPVHAGLTFIPLSLGVAITAGASYALMPRFGRKVLQGGLLLVAAALGWLAITVTHHGLGVSSWQLVPALLAFGLGMGFVFGPLFNVILAGVEDHEVGSASGTLNAIQQLGNSIGVAVLATIFFSLLDHGHLPPSAMTATALISAGLFVASFGLSFRLPKDARMEEI